jgi:hypothetical protein
MTDGIIQKVFNPRIKGIKLNMKYAVDRYRNRHEYLLQLGLLIELQQELIAEIKNAYVMDVIDHTYYERKFMFKLIGDNQE